LVRTTALVNPYDGDGIDAAFGPFFLTFSSDLPSNAKLCLNGPEDGKRQLAKDGMAFAALDNGIRSCDDPPRLQASAAGLTAPRIDALRRKWLARLPHPFTAADRQAGYRSQVSILQADFSLTHVLDRPGAGRIFVAEVIRANRGLGRPDNVQRLFARRVTKRPPGRLRTRVVTAGVLPSLYGDYTSSRLKQYSKEGRALRTETVINDTYDFGIGRRLEKLPRLRELGLAASRRRLDVQPASPDGRVGDDVLRVVTSPHPVGTHRASAVASGNELVLLLLQLLLRLRLLPCGCRNRELRVHLARWRGQDPEAGTAGQMTYQLRRLRRHGLSERRPGTHSYQVTERGLRGAWFFTRSYARVVRPGLTEVLAVPLPEDTSLQQAFAQVERAREQYAAQAKV
jgi:hypothetical protein